MASPQNIKSAPKSPPAQDSPIYQYVSSLSPIKPVNARSGVQAYDNIDVPSPQLVFKTPNFSRMRNLDLLERSRHMAATGSESLSPAYAGNSTSFSGNMEVRGPSVSVPMSQIISCNLKGCGNADPSPDQPTVSPSSCVDAYLTDPVEADDNLSSSPDFCVKRAVKAIQVYSTITDESKMKCFKEDSAEDQPQSPGLPDNELVDDSSNNSTSAVLHVLHLKQDADLPSTQNDSTDNKESTVALQAVNAKKDASNIGVESLSARQNEEHLGEVPTTSVSLTAPDQIEDNLRNLHMSEEAFNIDRVPTGEKLEPLTKNASVNTESHLLPLTSTQQHNVVNQYAADNLVSVSKDSDMGSHVKENISASSFSQGPQDLNLLASKVILSDTLDCTPQLHPDSPHNIQEGGIHVENLGPAVSVSTGKQISYNQEDGAQHQRGKRKRLQFESVENLRASTGCNSNSCSLTLEDSIVESPIPPLDTETINASHAESITVSNSTPVIESVPGNFLCRLSVDVDIYGEYQVTTQGTAPRPSGIGLHLNSVGSSGPTISNSTMQMPTRVASIQEEKCFVEHNDQVSQKLKTCLAPMSSLGPPVTLSSSSEHSLSYAGTENYGEKRQGDQANIIPNSSVNYHSPIFVKPINQSLPPKLTDLCMTPCTMKRLSSEEVSRSGDSTQSSPRKKRHEEGS
ncbi:uncharacterized protein M6B38_414460 [Iris pallida]|uniref:Uncharacterized protein n=1 Tax=Iris pallida TaxID=29817 RepID=A0AAX6FJH0_IRIPA|nr:uncharacterized protein M6B38_414460 [Iris pallida]